MGSFAEYLDARERNRALFRESQKAVLDAFEVSNRAFDELVQILGTQRDANGNSHVSLLPFLFLFQRQAMAAFDSLSTNQAFLAWVALRPGIECALIVGKWLDDKENATIWERRFDNPKAYSRVYQGTGLESRAYPDSGRIRKALSHMNDLFLHPNPRYYFRHLELEPGTDGSTAIKLNFFDEPGDVHVGLLGILHLVAFSQDRLAQMFAALFPDARRLDVGLASLDERAGEWARTLMRQDHNAAWLLENIGLWGAAT